MRSDWFLDENTVMIGAIEPEEAQIANSVRSKPLPFDPDRGRDYAVRSFGGNPSPPSGWIEDFHLQAVDHARHTQKDRLAAVSPEY